MRRASSDAWAARGAAPWAALWLAVGALACRGQATSVAPTEPVQISGGQLIPGALPGLPPPAPAEAGAAGGPGALAIDDAISRPFGPLIAGATHQQFSGFATSDTVAIGVSFVGGGTGYWVVPVGGLDPIMAGKVDWGFFADFNPAITPGRHALRLVAIDAAGGAGTQVDVAVCIDTAVPDNGHVCIPDHPPPPAVVSLQWDDDFDLDLHVVTPDGTDIGPKNPGGLPDGGAPDGGVASIDRDSEQGCVRDGFRREDLVFSSPPPAGTYDIFVTPFAACGQAAARFTVTVYARGGTCPDCALAPTFTQSGELLAIQATGAPVRGLFIGEVALPQVP
jgi:hypothetical protein